VLCIRITLTRLVDPSYPGWVEFHFEDAAGNVNRFVEKVPVVTNADLDGNFVFPQAGVIACREVSRRIRADGREVVTIDTELPWGIESATRRTQFDVLPEQLENKYS